MTVTGKSVAAVERGSAAEADDPLRPLVNQRLSRQAVSVIAMCLLLMVCDSYNVAAIAYAAPAIMPALNLTPFEMGLVFSSGLTGLLVGSLALGGLGDRIGRRPAIIVGAASFSVLTLVTAMADGFGALLLLRFLSGVGLGGVVPNAVALVGEVAQPRYRATAVGITFAGYAGGGILAGLLATRIVPSYGWSSMFVLGGVGSLAITLLVTLRLPESPGHRHASAGSGAAAALDARVIATKAHGVSALFRDELRLATPLLWLIYILTSLTVFSLASWMPAILAKSDGGMRAASLSTALLYTGGALGGIAAAKLADRRRFKAVTAVALLGFPMVALIGVTANRSGLLYLSSFLAGATALGVQTSLHGLVGSLYPTRNRATGAGWALGIAKIGSIIGPVAGGVIVTRLSPASLFLCAALPLIAVAGLAKKLDAVLTRHWSRVRTR